MGLQESTVNLAPGRTCTFLKVVLFMTIYEGKLLFAAKNIVGGKSNVLFPRLDFDRVLDLACN